MARTATVTRNVLNALASEKALERNGTQLRLIARQLNRAGCPVTADALRVALDSTAETRYGPWGAEYRLRSENYDATRECVDAVYRVTDTLDRTPNAQGWETVRPIAFSKCLGHLRLRWAKGNFSVPRESTIRGWLP